MNDVPGIDILFVAGCGPVADDGPASRALYMDALGIPFKEEENGYLHTDQLEGVQYFAVWPLSQAAESCFGTETWPDNTQAPQAWIEFDVRDIDAATEELAARGYELLVAAREEPWGQIVSRFLSPEGLLIGLTVTPWMRPEGEE